MNRNIRVRLMKLLSVSKTTLLISPDNPIVSSPATPPSAAVRAGFMPRRGPESPAPRSDILPFPPPSARHGACPAQKRHPYLLLQRLNLQCHRCLRNKTFFAARVKFSCPPPPQNIPSVLNSSYFPFLYLYVIASFSIEQKMNHAAQFTGFRSGFPVLL